ncbi:MAG: hypothetical protein CMH22_05530 [Methylophaga sp.]|nr:hypothetical protein [Methylophaga sp.]|tara:strand:- start:117334 stop:117645 length:312 start_codon:yes stop_codon:yes gene_type:complete
MKSKILGVITGRYPLGCQAYSIDAETGKIIASHFCSNEVFAKSDLGFTEPSFTRLLNEPHSTEGFNRERRDTYSKLYPNGYTLEWVGNIENVDGLAELFNQNN